MWAFETQVAVVTGASSGIGRAIALQLAKEGAFLCLVGRKMETLEAVANIAANEIVKIRSYPTDLSNRGDIERLIQSISKDFDRVDLLIHSAGDISWGPIETMPFEDLERQFRVNVYAPYLLTQGLLSKLRTSQGQVVFINSSSGIANAKAYMSGYAASKHSLKAIADSLRNEVNSEGVRVLSVFPGRTASPMQATFQKFEGREYKPELLLQPEDVAMAIIAAIRLPRTAEVTDLQIRPFIKSY
jgi:short-subunit dehydrogenase